MKKKKIKFPVEYHCDVFKETILFLHEWSIEAADRYLKERFQYEGDFKCSGFFQPISRGDESILLIWTNDSPTAIDTLVHECIHCANYIFHTAGQKLDANNDEFQAYYVTNLFRQGR